MQKIYVLIALCFIAVGCSKDQDNSVAVTSEENDSRIEIESDISATTSLIDSVNARYTDYEDFQLCAQRAEQECVSNSEGKFWTCSQKWLDQCMVQYSWFTWDRSAVACEDFLSVDMQESCNSSKLLSQAIQARDLSLCTQLPDTKKNKCESDIISIQAQLSNDVALCENIAEDFDKVLCKNQIVLSNALSELDVSLCESIISFDESDTENLEKQLCIQQINDITNIDSELSE